MLEFFKYVTSNFWIFIGTVIILALLFEYIFKPYKLFWRHMNIRNQGWPPEHLDADGDFYYDNSYKENDDTLNEN